ncbi:MAG: methyltransferase domain-containing protein [Desulfobacterales bacterium]|jgi:2-polyprenyl-3-methyl-5-hydroxy-6-metoxy-1,4-benzoquinol methylase
MRVDYSKSSKAIEKASLYRVLKDHELSKRQIHESMDLLKFNNRKECVLCGNALRGENFYHRNIPFVVCDTCKHIQTKTNPPSNYPRTKFSSVYLEISEKDYQDRKKRVYKPKLDWIINCLSDHDYPKDRISKMQWTEIGAGAGYFLSSLLDAGLRNIKGFDADKKLVQVARDYVPEKYIMHYEGNLSEAMDLFPSDIYTAFFVLEHISDAKNFFIKLKTLPKGTIFIFSVPVFGLSCLFENIFENNYARNLDCVLHTQLYTDDSIKFAMKKAGFKIIAKWIFGQDAEDIIRFILKDITPKFSLKIVDEIQNDLYGLQDSMQNCFDKLNLSDQRHIIAIKS